MPSASGMNLTVNVLSSLLMISMGVFLGPSTETFNPPVCGKTYYNSHDNIKIRDRFQLQWWHRSTSFIKTAQYYNIWLSQFLVYVKSFVAGLHEATNPRNLISPTPQIFSFFLMTFWSKHLCFHRVIIAQLLVPEFFTSTSLSWIWIKYHVVFTHLITQSLPCLQLFS